MRNRRLYRRFTAGVLLGVVVEVAVFVVVNRDVLYVSRPLPEILAGSRDAFESSAMEAMERQTLRRHHVEAIASASRSFGLRRLEVAALERCVRSDPADRQARLRLADALRRAGRLRDAERIYLDVLDSERSRG